MINVQYVFSVHKCSSLSIYYTSTKGKKCSYLFVIIEFKKFLSVLNGYVLRAHTQGLPKWFPYESVVYIRFTSSLVSEFHNAVPTKPQKKQIFVIETNDVSKKYATARISCENHPHFPKSKNKVTTCQDTAKGVEMVVACGMRM